MGRICTAQGVDAYWVHLTPLEKRGITLYCKKCSSTTGSHGKKKFGDRGVRKSEQVVGATVIHKTHARLSSLTSRVVFVQALQGTHEHGILCGPEAPACRVPRPVEAPYDRVRRMPAKSHQPHQHT